MATLTKTSSPRDLNSSDRLLACSFVGPASYATNGEAVDFDGDLGVPEPVATIRGCNDARTHFCEYDPVNNKMVCYTAGAEVPNTTDLSAITFKCVMLLPR